MFRHSRNLTLPLNEDELPTPQQALLQPRTQMVKCLLSLKASTKETNSEEIRWEERFALALVKNMVSRSYDELLKALASRGTQPTKCVFIKRPSMDGRMQIGSRKVVPHVAVYKLWRNPSVKQATQLTSCHPATSSCFQTTTPHSANTTGANTSSTSSSAKANSLSQLQENTCINPYHYQLTVPIEITTQRKLSSQQGLSSDANFVDSSSDETNMEHGSLTSQNSVELCASDEDEAAAFALQQSISLDTDGETLSSSNFTPVYSLSGRKSVTGVERSASAENFTPILSSLLTSSVCSSPGFEPTSATKICSTELHQAVVSIAETSSNILSVHDDLQLDGLEDNDLTSIHDHSVETFGDTSERKDSICFFTDVKSEPISVCAESVTTKRTASTSDANPAVSRISSVDASMTITSTHPSQTVYALNGQTIQTLHQSQHHLGHPHTHHQPYDSLTSMYNFDPVISSDHHHQVYRHQYNIAGVNSSGVPMVVPGSVSGGSTVAMGSPENSQGVILQQLNPSVTPVPASSSSSARQPQSQQQQHFSANNNTTGSCSVFYDLTSPLTPNHSNTPSSNASPGASSTSSGVLNAQQQNSASLTGITYEDANRGTGSGSSSSNLITLEAQPQLQHQSSTGSCGSSLTSSPLGGTGLGNNSTGSASAINNPNQQRQQPAPAPPITSNFMQSSPPDCEFMEYEDQTPMLSNDSENQYSEIVAISSTMTQQQQSSYISGSRKTSASSFHSQSSPLPHSQSKYPNHGRNMGSVDTSGGMGGGYNHGYPQGNTAPSYVPHMQQPPPPSHNDGSYSHHNSSKHMQTNTSSVLPLSAASHLSSNINDPTPLDDIMLQSPRTGMRMGFPVRYVQPLFWCQIRYYEFSQQIGEVCYVSPNQFSVDGGTDPSSIDRFCLGSLSNVNRQEIVEITRNNIGKGLQLFRTKNDEIYAKCLSDSPLFVQSQCCNLRYRWDPGTVCKIPPDYNLKLFTMEEFQRHLNDQLRSNSSYKSIMDLTSLCSIRISFIKGWGQEYTRKRITDVPCWIEILLNGPSQWLDRVLQRINPSSEPCDSR